MANHWLAGNPVAAQVAVLYYRLYYLPLAGVVVWVLFRRGEVYPVLRRTLVVMASLALLVFWLLPMAPPRFALPGIVDVVAAHDRSHGVGCTEKRRISARTVVGVGSTVHLWGGIDGLGYRVLIAAF